MEEQNGHKPGLPEDLPVCPYCGADPAAIKATPLQLSPTVEAVALHCANKTCRKMFAVQVLSMRQPQIVPAATIPRVHKV